MHTYLLHHLLEDGASRWPDDTAVLFKDRSLSYSELLAGANRVASFLAGNGVAPGDRVGIMTEKSVESIVSVFGVLKAGAAYVPFDPSTPPGRIRHIVESCRIGTVIASPKGAAALAGAVGDRSGGPPAVLVAGPRGEEAAGGGLFPRTAYWEELPGEGAVGPPDTDSTDLRPAYILHTSGSTGVPKGVVISHRNALAFVDMAKEFFGVGPGDRLANHAPLNFDLSMFDIYTAIRAGAAVVPVPEILSVFPVRLAEYIERKSVTVWNSVSSVLSLLAARGTLENFGFRSLRTVIFSGEILPVKYLRILKSRMRNAVFYNIYGQTEANSSTFYRVGDIPDNDAWKIPIGRPFPNFEVFLLDEAGRAVEAPGGEGELYVKGSTVAMGYWGDEARTRERFVPDPRLPGSPACVYRTGDLARIGEDGNLVFGGRKDHLVKSRGYRIELDEIEIALASCPDVRQAAAIPVPDDLVGNRIFACVSRAEGAALDATALRGHCGRILPPYMVPDEILFFRELPRNDHGKVDRRALLENISRGTPS
jgi:amino acid adenylation domain-containing protein